MIVRLMSGQLFLSKASIWVVPQNISFVPFYFGMGLFIFFIKKAETKNEKTDKAMARLTTLTTKKRHFNHHTIYINTNFFGGIDL